MLRGAMPFAGPLRQELFSNKVVGALVLLDVVVVVVVVVVSAEVNVKDSGPEFDAVAQ
jgi:hypothetical protein